MKDGIVDYLIQHREGIALYILPLSDKFLEREEWFKDVPEVFKEAHECFVLGLVRNLLIENLSVDFQDVSDISYNELERLKII